MIPQLLEALTQFRFHRRMVDRKLFRGHPFLVQSNDRGILGIVSGYIESLVLSRRTGNRLNHLLLQPSMEILNVYVMSHPTFKSELGQGPK